MVGEDEAGLGLGVDLVGHDAFSRGDLGRRQLVAGDQFQHVEATRDLAAVDAAVEPVGRPGAADDQLVGVDRTAVEPGDLDRLHRIGEVHHRDAALVPGLDHQVAAGDGDQIAVVGDAVLGRALGRGQFVEAAAGQGAVVDGGDHIGAPGGRVGRLTARADAAAPFIGEDDLVAGVVEGGRVPVGHVGVEDVGHPGRVLRVRDVQQDAVAAAGAGGQPDLGIDGDVVALVGLGGALAGEAGGPAAPQAGDASAGVGEDAGAVDDGGVLRPVEVHLDDVDREQGGVRIGVRLAVRADGQFPGLAHARGALVVDIQAARIGRVRDQGVGVRAAAGLDGGDLARGVQVADVEDAHAAEAFGVDVALGTRGTAVQPAAVLLDRHEQQIAVHRDIALTAGADHRHDQPGRAARDVIGVEAVEISDEEPAMRDRHVAVGQRQRAVAGRIVPHPGREGLALGLGLGRGEQGLGIEEAGSGLERGFQHHAGGRLPGVAQAAGQGGARVRLDGLARLGGGGGGGERQPQGRDGGKQKAANVHGRSFVKGVQRSDKRDCIRRISAD